MSERKVILVHEAGSSTTLEKFNKFAGGVALIAIPITLALMGYAFDRALQDKSDRQSWVGVATSILREPTDDWAYEDIPLREWAIDLLEAYTPVPIPDDVRDDLTSGAAGFADAQSVDTPFGLRSSMLDLLSRDQLRALSREGDAFATLLLADFDIDEEIAHGVSQLETVAPDSLDAFWLRERIIIMKLQSRQDYPSAAVMIDTHREALERAGLLTDDELTQLDVLAAVYAVKATVNAGARDMQRYSLPEGSDEEQELRAAADVLGEFFRSQPRSAGRLTEDARRDPVVRLAGRALRWVASPRMLDIPDLHELSGREYQD